MRIAYLNPSGRLGGAEACLLDMLAVLRRARPEWEVSVILGEDGPLVQRVKSLGATIEVLPFPSEVASLGDSGESNRAALALRILRTTPSALTYRNTLRKSLEKIQPDIVHTNGFKMHVLGAMVKPVTSKLVWHVHDYVSSRTMMARMLRRFSSRADMVITNSQSVAGDARRTLHHRNVIPVLNVVDLDEFCPEGPKLDLDAVCAMSKAGKNCVRVGLVATMAWWKGHRLFLDAISKVDKSLPIRAYVIGGSVYQTGSKQESVDALRQYANQLGLADRVGFTGFVAEPASAMRALDIVVHASTEPEPFGRVIVEAMACGKPVISNGVGGAGEILAIGDVAEAFESGSAESLANTISQVATNKVRRQEFGSNGLKIARERFGRGRLAKELSSIYESLRGVRNENVLRVLHLHSGNMMGGIESALQTFADFAGTCPEFQQEFALAFEGRFAAGIRRSGLALHLLPEVQLRNPVSVVRSRRSLLRLLRERHYDAVISHSPWCQVVYAPVIRAAKLPLLFWMHGAFDGHWLQKLASRHVPDFAICNSSYTQSTLGRVYPNVPGEIVHHAVRPSVTTVDRNSMRSEFNARPEDTVILMASRMEVWKGHFNLLHAAAALRAKNDWVIWIAGGAQTAVEKEYYGSVVAEVKRLKLSEKVRFLGQRSDVPALMGAADIFCQPNAGPEPFGVVFVEALQAGVPVVTFSMGGPQEILDENCGILVAPGDIQQLAAALVYLIDDPQERVRLGNAGPARAKLLCDPSRQVRRIFETVKLLTQKTKGMSA